MTRLSIIAAMTQNGVIGNNNALPWHMPADLGHFRRLTTGHPVIMGRKNYESIGRPLPNRTNIVITQKKDFAAPGCTVVHSIHDAIRAAGNDPEIFIIGGTDIYRQTLVLADRMYITLIHADIRGDTRFPECDWREWREAGREDHHADARNLYPFSFVVFERARARNDATDGVKPARPAEGVTADS